MKRQGRNHYKSRQLVGKLALVDLAGSERAAETNNFGHKLRDGANINRSLLSLANCINQLGKAGASGGRAYIPYRNSKLTRLLKVRTAHAGDHRERDSGCRGQGAPLGASFNRSALASPRCQHVLPSESHTTLGTAVNSCPCSIL